MKKNISCPCGRTFIIEHEDEVDLDNNPEHIESICCGRFMSFICPDCGKKHKPEYRIILVWKSKNIKFEVLPELERYEFYSKKKKKIPYETIIGFPEMADRITVIRDGLEPVVIETLKYYLLAKAEENYPDRNINAWYHDKSPSGIEFHLDGIRTDEVAVMKVPQEVYDKTLNDYRKRPESDTFAALRFHSYLSVQNIFKPDALK
jgi:hypothetical protein